MARVWNAISLFPDTKFLAQLGWIGVIWFMYFMACSIVGILQPPSLIYPVFGVSLLLIDRDSPGVSVSAPLKKMGWLCSDTAEIGFDDSFIYDEFALAPSARSLPSERMLPDEAIRAFELWRDQEDKTPY